MTTSTPSHSQDVCTCGYRRVDHFDGPGPDRRGRKGSRLAPHCKGFTLAESYLQRVGAPNLEPPPAPDFARPIGRIAEAWPRLIEAFRSHYRREYTRATTKGQPAPNAGQIGDWGLVHGAFRAALLDVRQGVLAGLVANGRWTEAKAREFADASREFFDELEDAAREDKGAQS